MMAGIGHNRGPVTEGAAWRSHCWTHARRELLGPRLPVEIVRTRVARARALGLDYKTYAGIRSTTGRDLVAFLFSSNGLGVFRNGQPLPSTREAQIQMLDASRHLGCAPGLDTVSLGRTIGAVSARRLPAFGAKWTEMRDGMKAWLRDQKLPGDAVLMIGETDHERELMAAGGLAGFLTGQHYFEGQRHGF
ncbi:hypothetical protein MLD63_05920 [Paracoccus sp. TK19116]|uniref:Uncharacterized protein n=1 Tax=Paracoccus albicereus TaxID=2922394 RepID=A0ABT1MNU8_9RHOB|nr:hypothetical protein [Paracoccus albicereus]MCQ0969962.1 hypothetical protein [Paracoccus albicereus]